MDLIKTKQPRPDIVSHLQVLTHHDRPRIRRHTNYFPPADQSTNHDRRYNDIQRSLPPFYQSRPITKSHIIPVSRISSPIVDRTKSQCTAPLFTSHKSYQAWPPLFTSQPITGHGYTRPSRSSPPFHLGWSINHRPQIRRHPSLYTPFFNRRPIGSHVYDAIPA